jgi:hypothetical protein
VNHTNPPRLANRVVLWRVVLTTKRHWGILHRFAMVNVAECFLWTPYQSSCQTKRDDDNFLQALRTRRTVKDAQWWHETAMWTAN